MKEICIVIPALGMKRHLPCEWAAWNYCCWFASMGEAVYVGWPMRAAIRFS